MIAKIDLRERQAPLKARYQQDPESAKLTLTVRSATKGDHPMYSQMAADSNPDWTWDVSAHPYAGGEGESPCSGDIFLASLAACQEVTLRMVAAAMGIQPRLIEVEVEGDLDFRGTMGVDPETPVGFEAIRMQVRIEAEAPPDRLERLVHRAEKYCVIASTLREPPSLQVSVEAHNPTAAAS